MKLFSRISLTLVAALLVALPAQAEKKVRMATIAPGSSAYLVMTTMASAVNAAQDDINITVDATGAATKHQIEAAKGKLDVYMTSPTIYKFMSEGTRMYKKLSAAPELSKNVGLLFWFPFGSYHTVVYADSGIKTLADLKGKKVFLGPPGGGAFAAAKLWMKAATGMEPGKDFQAVKASWGAALQGFQDRQFDAYFDGGIPPYPRIEQLALTSKLRLLGVSKSELEANPQAVKLTSSLGRYVGSIPEGSYGDNVSSNGDVYTLGSLVGVGARMDLSEDVVYTIVKHFWENIDDIRKSQPFMKRVTLEGALSSHNMKLHPGALKYYKEIGLEIPAKLM